MIPEDAHAQAIGYLVMKFAELHAVLGDLFVQIIYLSHEMEDPYVFWNGPKSEREQRQNLRINAEQNIVHDAFLLQSICDLLARIDRLHDFRNDVIHAPYTTLQSLGGTKCVVPFSFNEQPNAVRIEQVSMEGALTREIDAKRDEIDAIMKECEKQRLRVIDYKDRDL